MFSSPLTSDQSVLSLRSLNEARDVASWLSEGISAGIADKPVACADWASDFPVRRGRKLRHLGGTAWRFRQKFKWLADALRSRLFPVETEDSLFES